MLFLFNLLLMLYFMLPMKNPHSGKKIIPNFMAYKKTSRDGHVIDFKKNNKKWTYKTS